MFYFLFFFFFSSRRRHTRSYGDWSSDVCSSDLGGSMSPTVPPPWRRRSSRSRCDSRRVVETWEAVARPRRAGHHAYARLGTSYDTGVVSSRSYDSPVVGRAVRGGDRRLGPQPVYERPDAVRAVQR